MVDGHLPRLARLIQQERSFVKLIKRVFVDEAHFIHSAGAAQYGLPAFRPAWGRLGEFRIKLGKAVPVQALSGTQPPHIKSLIINSLLLNKSDFLALKLTSNRPNIIYATHRIAGELSDFRNLDFLIPANCPLDFRPRKTVVFHDDSEECANAAMYLDHRLHSSQWDTGIVQHYHGKMSTEYLTHVYEDFSNTNGTCRILHATSGASTACPRYYLCIICTHYITQGLDIPDIEVVIQYGITRDVPSTLQRAGRGGRNATGLAVFLMMYEPWVLDIDLSASGVEESVSALDPDYPHSGKLTKYSTKQQRTGRAMVSIVQSTTCIRKMFAEYLKDQSIEGMVINMIVCIS